jgi:hypothetical protein
MPTDNNNLQSGEENQLLEQMPENTLWLSISESSKLGGVTNKTIRRAIQSKSIRYKIIKNRYLVDFSSVIKYLHSNTKLKNKFQNHGLGQYVEKWK